MDIQSQQRLSELTQRADAFERIVPKLKSVFGTSWHRLTPRDFYGRLPDHPDKIDGCLLCGAEAHKQEHGIKSYTCKNDCPLIVLGIVERGQMIEVNW
jgi:hypothetical protein